MSGPSNSKSVATAQPTETPSKPMTNDPTTKTESDGIRDVARQASHPPATFSGVPTGPRSLSKRPAQYRPPVTNAASTAPFAGVPTGPRAMRKPPVQQAAIQTDPEMSKLSDHEIEQKLIANKSETERIARRLANLEAQEAAER